MSVPRGSNHREELYAVIPAAGAGSRMNRETPKQYLRLNNIPVLKHTIDRLLALDELVKIVVVIDAESIGSIDSTVFDNQKPDVRIEFCIGGASRAESVKNGLDHLKHQSSSASKVLVHDAARPCVRVADIQRLIDEVKNDINGGLLAMPVSDTIKRATRNNKVLDTVDRSLLWRAATPQLFNLDALCNALDKAMRDGIEITDEASAMQYAGHSPTLVECQADNIKITTATDLVLAEHYLAAQQHD